MLYWGKTIPFKKETSMRPIALCIASLLVANSAALAGSIDGSAALALAALVAEHSPNVKAGDKPLAKVGLLELAKQLGNVSQACKMLGYSRDRFKEIYDICGRPLKTLGRLRSYVRPVGAALKSAGPDEVRRRRFLSKARALMLMS